MSMAFDDAVSTLEAMFPDWDKDTLTTVLVSNNYHVERTIESIFIMQGDSSVTDSPRPESNQSQPQRVSDLLFAEEAPPPRAKAHKKRRNSDPRYRGIRCDLPNDFLRPPTWEGSNHIIADEELALMLQNEMFQREVRQVMGDDFLGRDIGNLRNEFSSNPYFQDNGNNIMYEGGTGRSRGDSRSSGGRGNATGPARRPSGGDENADLGIMKALSSMGGAAKRNLSVLAERFSQTGSATTGGTSKEFKPLVDSGGNSNDDDEDGDEVISFDTSRGRNTHLLDDSPRTNAEFQNPLLLNNSNYRTTNNVGVSNGSSMKKDK